MHSATAEPTTRKDRAAKFLARIDEQLETFWTTYEKLDFLEEQLTAWQGAYDAFRRTDGASEPVTDPTDPPQAADFTITIVGIQARHDRIAVERKP